MAVVVAAILGVVGLVAVELFRRAAETRRTAMAAAADRGDAYEAFVSEALEAVGTAQRATSLAPRVGFLPPNHHLRDLLKSIEKSQVAVGNVHARVRRVAPDDVAEAADAVLEVVARAGQLLGERRGDAADWDVLWSDARDARFEFERRARTDAGSRQ